MEQDNRIVVKLTDEERKKVFRLAALRSIETGKRLSAGDTVRALALTAIENIDGTDDPTAGKDEIVKFKPAPEIAKALKRARLNSGTSTDAVINTLLAEALQLEGVPA